MLSEQGTLGMADGSERFETGVGEYGVRVRQVMRLVLEVVLLLPACKSTTACFTSAESSWRLREARNLPGDLSCSDELAEGRSSEDFGRGTEGLEQRS